MKPKIPAGSPKPKPKAKTTSSKVAGSRTSGASRSAARPTGASLRAILAEAGFKGQALDTAYAVAMAESGGNALAFNGNRSTGDQSYGLFQINMLGAMGPERLKRYGLSSNDDLLDPLTNAKVAYALSNGGRSWQPWSTYKNGAYRQYLGGGDTQISGVGRRGMSAPVGGGDGSVGYNLGPDATTLDPQMLAQDYGFASAFYNGDPTLKNLIGEAVKEQWTPEQFAARLKGTDWYRQHDAAQREWYTITTNDPAEATQRIADRRQALAEMAHNLGIPVPGARMAQLTEASLKFGWNQQQMQSALSAEFSYRPSATYGGQAGQTLASFRQQAADYLVPISNATMQKWTQSVLAGENTPDQFSSYLKEQAKSLFPSLASALDRGVTVSQYLDPYKQLAAQTLEIDPESVNWMDPKWSQAVFQTNPQDGQRGPMSLSQWQTTLRTDPKYGYDQTQAARTDAASLSSKIQQLMGALG